MTNPYDPQSPAKPDYFGGRKQILEVVSQRIEKAIEQNQSGGILAYGYRGVGKTSLVKKIISLIQPGDRTQNNAVAIYRRLGKTTSDNELYQIITEDLIEEIKHHKSVLEKIKDSASSLKSIKISEVELNMADDFDKKSNYHKWRSIIRNLKNVSYIIIAIDDADYLSTEAIGELKTIVEEQNPTPILLVVSGGVEFESKLVEEYSPIARIFSGASFNLGEFTVDETKEVLEKPVQGTKTSWSNEAVKEVQRLSKGYPYLVQCIAHASYQESAIIPAKRVTEQLDSALKLGSPWLNHELKNASDNDIISFLKIIGLGNETIKSSEMAKVGIQPPYIGRLVKQGVIEQVSRGRYRLKKPPIVALYHSLKRGIRHSENHQKIETPEFWNNKIDDTWNNK